MVNGRLLNIGEGEVAMLICLLSGAALFRDRSLGMARVASGLHVSKELCIHHDNSSITSLYGTGYRLDGCAQSVSHSPLLQVGKARNLGCKMIIANFVREIDRLCRTADKHSIQPEPFHE